ncbi:MAG: acyltransferase domain-containing protein [Moorea sp. SIOASIH]|uniref:type I polyketide synthase n=1 Tax=Moorena sp. SIOASIH TaxID=2607817 RepID=UPI0013B8F812|nr:type I polyketide synthase [Moorena sp. SIOASIH]NEO36799.1 acyltransferase domain-containing protein [Moorena sp. SIOASIH]
MNNTSEPIDHSSRLKNALLAVRKMRSKLEAIERSKTEPLAIIGMGCRFPGGADNPDKYWSLLHDGVDAITEVPKDRWDIEQYYDPDPDAPGKMYVRNAGFIDQVDQFDAKFFGITPREAVSMDPQHRLLLEVSWAAIEQACQSPEQLRNSQTGVFVGITTNDYLQLQTRLGDQTIIDAYTATGNCLNAVAGRLSYTLGLQGPSMAVDTACSSSLVTVHLACQSLRNRDCDLALAGGVNLILSPDGTIATSRARMLARDGRCKTFDAAADGFARGEGCGMVVLKRLSDAIADRDNILALIRGTAVNQDGPSSGLTVPNGPAQQAVIRKALANGRVKPEQVSYVEAHGTGTSLGDPIEVESLAAVLCQKRTKDQPLIIGSAKTNIGHLESAAGVAGLIKLVLALQHQQIPPHLHLKNPNPYIPWDKLPIQVPTELTPWHSTNQPRIAGLSGFGVSGTNAHIVVEQATIPEPVQVDVERPEHLLNLSAKTEQALQQLANRFEMYLATHPEVPLTDVCFTANTTRARFDHRLAVVAHSKDQLCQHLAAFQAGQTSPGVFTAKVKDSQPKIAFLFTGQGSQYVGMAHQLYQQAPTFRQALDRCAQILQPYLEKPLLEILYPQGTRTRNQSSLLDQTPYTQPALFAIEYALSELWRSWGIEPDAVLGQGVGEYVAACIKGAYSLEDALKLSVTGSLVGETEMTSPRDGSGQEQQSVTFESAMETLQTQGYELFVEIGPDPVLLGIGQQCLTVGVGVWLPSLRRGQSDWQQLLESLAQLSVQGVAVDWSGFDQDYQRRLVPLPTYPFQRERFWFETQGLEPGDYHQPRPIPQSHTPESPHSGRSTQNEALSVAELTLEQRVLGLVAKTTGIAQDQLGLDMSLEGELGLDSIMITQLMNGLVKLIPQEQKAAFSSQFSLRDLMQLQTIREIIQVLEQWQVSVPVAASRSDREDTLGEDTLASGESKENSQENAQENSKQNPTVTEPDMALTPAENQEQNSDSSDSSESIELLHGQYFHLVGYWLVNSNSLFSSLRLEGDFDLDIAWASWKDLLVRHPMLRSHFHVPSGATSFKDYQLEILDNPTPPEILFIDIQHLDSEAKDEAVAEEIDHWLNYEWSLTQWPLHQFSVIRLEDSVYQLFLGIEHVISDGLSNHVIIREFMEIYRARSCGEEPILPPATSLKDYAEVVAAMNAWQDPEEDQALAKYTASQGKESYIWNPKGKPVDYQNSQFYSHKYCLTQETTDKLIAKTAEWRLPVNSLLLGAFLRAVVKLDSHDLSVTTTNNNTNNNFDATKSPIIQIPTSGRVYPEVDASNVVSSFAQNLALSFAPPQPDEDWQALLNRIHQVIQNGIASGIDRAQTRQMGMIFKENIALENGEIPEHTLPMFRSALKSNLYFPYTGHTHIKTQYGSVNVTDYQAGGINAPGTVDILQEVFDGRLHMFASYDYNFFELSEIDNLMTEYIAQIEELVSLTIQPEQPSKSQQPLPTNTAIESTLRQVTEEICHYPISADEMDLDLEADLGVDSLERIRIVTHLEKLYGKVDRQGLLSCRSVQEMASTLSQSFKG